MEWPRRTLELNAVSPNFYLCQKWKKREKRSGIMVNRRYRPDETSDKQMLCCIELLGVPSYTELTTIDFHLLHQFTIDRRVGSVSVYLDRLVPNPLMLPSSRPGMLNIEITPSPSVLSTLDGTC